MWQYKEEAERFEKLQSQYLYLHRNNIRSAEELENRKKDVSIRMDALDEQRHQIYKRRYPHKPVLALLNIIEENEIRASYYKKGSSKKGSSFYAANYEKWKEAVEILIQKGYTVHQVMEMKERYQRELAEVAKVKRELKKEENLINDIFFEKSRVQVAEKIMPGLEIKENATEIMHKGGDAEEVEPMETEIPAHADTKQLENKPAQSKEQGQWVQAR